MLYWNNATNAHAHPQKLAWARPSARPQKPARKSLPAQARPQKLALACLSRLVTASACVPA